ncbi:MAG: hypothetical protein C0524_08100 [Rhodobacter sp.]|nr:hypothetical protein [Rhodobacter sp.]
MAIADPAFGLGGSIAGEDPFGLLAEGLVEDGLDLRSGGIGDGADGTQPVAAEVGGEEGGRTFRSSTAGWG